ncbi:MAG TPA: hypothetical protein VN813_09465 [Luteibacter sp.]|nr:hypothetical protein [Luteibacter sp.]
MRSNNNLLCLFSVSMLLAGCGDLPSTSTQAQAPDAVPTIRFYEGWDGTQNNICTASIDSAPYYKLANVSNWDCPNDEAKSMKLHNLPAGSVIELYNDGDCADDDDWVQITVLKGRIGADDLIVGGFEGNGVWIGSGEDPNSYRSVFHLKRNRHDLHGKVSCAIIDVPGPHFVT